MSKKLLLLLSPLLLFLSPTFRSFWFPNPESLYPAVQSKVIKIQVKAPLPDDPFFRFMLAIQAKILKKPIPKFLTYSGSGVILNEHGKVVTAAHVINVPKALSIIGETTNGERFGCKVVSSDIDRDLALLDCYGLIGTRGISSFASLTLPIGSRVVAVGFAGGGPLIYSDGIVANRESEKGKLLLSVPAGPGMSGGAVFTYDGTLVGIIQAGYVRPPFTLITTSTLQLLKFLTKESL